MKHGLDATTSAAVWTHAPNKRLFAGTLQTSGYEDARSQRLLVQAQETALSTLPRGGFVWAR